MAIKASDKTDPDLIKALQGLAGSSTAASTGRVYMGDYSPTRPKGSSAQAWKNIQELAAKEDRSIWLSSDEASQDFYAWDQKKQADFVSKGVVAGLLKLGDGPMEGATLWKKLVKEAAQYGAVGQKVSPFDIMATYVQASGGGNAWTSAGVWQINTQTGERKYVGPGTYLGAGKAQQVDTRVDLTDPDTARAISTKLFQDLMGRDPGEGELSAYADALHSAEQNSPVVSSTTTQYDLTTGQPIGSSTTQSGGVTSDGKAYIQEQQVKKSPEYGAYQAATTYQNAFDALVFGSSE
ncbi:hypothetical protein ABZY09_30620 [Streptomyces sp. NPDC002928]|uniref:hypothetical protein n=1 Tax=Streptomyces sp. NPDC002928 TaxID=3154440 RepID=UPI0033B957D5